jgi:tetratricopeptide (TPR) repeat protein
MHAIATGARRRRPLGRRLLLLGQRVLRSDSILITVVALSMSLSAVAVYQATRAADEASDLLDQARIVSTEASRQVGYLQTLVDHDLDVLRTYCTAEVERDVARVTYLSSEPDLPALVTANLTLDALRPLLLGDQTADCAGGTDRGYDTRRAAERLEFTRADFASTSSSGAGLEAQASVFHRDEAFLMTSGFLFAYVVAAIIAIDQLGSRAARPGRLRSRSAHRWQYGLLASVAVALVLGLILLVVFAVDPLLTSAVIVGLVLILTAEWWWLRRRRGRDDADVVHEQPLRRHARPQWWAEMIGAVALIAFTASAVGLSLVSIQERDAGARADREGAVALDLQRVGQQQALRALASLSFIAQLDAEEVTARQLTENAAVFGLTGAVADPDAVAALREVVDERMRTADEDLRRQAEDTLDADVASDPDAACAVPDTQEAPLPSTLLEDLGSDPDSVLWYVLDQQVPSRACDVMSALSRQEARIWSAHGSTFTVALVVLGLAGFLLALASSTERSARSSRTLLLVGAVGTGVGVVLALLPLPALIAGTGVPRADDAQRFADTLAASESDSCAARDSLDEAIGDFAGYGPAFIARAYAADCGATVQEWPVLTSERRGDDIPAIIADLEQASAIGPVTPALQSSLGWYDILQGIEDDDDGALRRGLESTDAAIETMVGESEVAGNGLHIARFNRALALAALGEHHRALRAYQDADRCLDPAEGCEGGGLADEGVADDVRMWALADLELLDAATVADSYRAAILGLRTGRAPGPALSEARFDAYPQELQVAVLDGSARDDVAVVWYHRPDDSTTWGLLGEPTSLTLHGGDHLDSPVPAGWLLASGQYRADVYSGGRRTVFETEYEADGALARYESQRLGVSMVVPDTWYEWWDDGVEWHLGPDEYTGVTVRRLEGMVPTDQDVGAYLDSELASWWATAGDVDLAPAESPWLFGLTDVVVKEGPDADGDGFVDTVEGAALAPYASHWGCGGALFEIRATSTVDSPSARRLYDSIVLERPLDGLPFLGEELEADGISVQVPAWWDAAIRPPGSTGDLISAQDCQDGASLLLSTDEYEGDLATYVDDTIAYFEQAPEEYRDFELESREPLAVEGADEAELIVFTWVPDESGDAVRQWQMFGKRGNTIAYGTITTWAADLDYWQPDLEVILPSLGMTDP